jgi:hypothetical protein
MQARQRFASIFALMVLETFLVSPFAWAQDKKNTGKRQIITLRVVDGVTGLPEWFEFPNFWVGPQTSSGNPRLNIRGEVQIDVTDADPRVLGFLPNWYADCRYPGDVDNGMKVRYSVDDILETGVVGKNVCGVFHAKPKPGVIVLYVRHRTLLELIAL